MSDILSGGAIDETTSGPIPTSQDNRSLDIIAAAAAKQEREAIGGSQNPPTVEPPPPVPQPPEVAPPPLPDIDIPQLGIDFGPAVEAAREVARQTAVDVLKRVTIDGQGPVIEGSAISFNTERRSTASEDFGTGGNVNFLQPAYSRGRLDAADFGSRAGMEDNSSAIAYAAAEARGRAKTEADPSFDRESSQRQKGEHYGDYKRRQEELKQERAEETRQQEILQKARGGDLSELPSGMVPVRFTRADGQKKILALMATELVGVVEGATDGERTLSLPATSSFYEGGGSGATPPHPWKISLRTVPQSDPPVYEYKVELNSALYSDLESFSNIAVTGLDFWASASVGYLYLFGVIENGECTEASIQGPEEIPSGRIEFIDDEQNSFSTIIGYIYEDENENLVVKQDAFHNFTLMQTCINGKAALYPFAT